MCYDKSSLLNFLNGHVHNNNLLPSSAMHFRNLYNTSTLPPTCQLPDNNSHPYFDKTFKYHSTHLELKRIEKIRLYPRETIYNLNTEKKHRHTITMLETKAVPYIM